MTATTSTRKRPTDTAPREATRVGQAFDPHDAARRHVRLTLVDRSQGDHPVLDGAWWPRSLDLARELPALVLELTERGIRASRVAYNMGSWDPAPRRLRVEDLSLRLGWFPGLDPHLLRLTGDAGQLRLDLLVIPPDLPEVAAEHAFAAASERSNDATASHLLGSLGEQLTPLAGVVPSPRDGAAS